MYQNVPSIFVICLTLTFCTTAVAQTGNEDGAGGSQTNGGLGGSSSGPREIGSSSGLDDAFSAVERGDEVGNSAGGNDAFGAATANGNGGVSTGFGALGGIGGFQNLFPQGGNNAQSTRPIIRTQLRSAVSTRSLSPGFLQQSATNNLRRIRSQQYQLQNVRVDVSRQTAVISGTVPNERSRRMSELLMRLEPGVRHVDNRVIATQP